MEALDSSASIINRLLKDKDGEPQEDFFEQVSDHPVDLKAEKEEAGLPDGIKALDPATSPIDTPVDEKELGDQFYKDVPEHKIPEESEEALPYGIEAIEPLENINIDGSDVDR